MKSLKDKVIVISGAASGIGRSTARAFAQEGSRLHLTDIDELGLESLGAELRTLGCKVDVHQVDCTEAEQVLALAEKVMSLDGRVDVLHNNAGVVVGGPVEKLSLDDWRWQIGVNLWGVVHGVHAFVPHMIRQGSGHIINTASMSGLLGFPFVVPYTASKFAVVGLSESLGLELASKGIQVTAICPASVKTNVLQAARLRLPGGWDDRVRNGVSRMAADPDWIAGKVLNAVKQERSMVILAREMTPIWLLKRLSIGAYQSTARFLTRKALGMKIS